MTRFAWLKVGAVAVLWTIVAAAAVSGWVISRGEAARQISKLHERLAAADTSPKQSCGLEVELLDARIGDRTAPSNLRRRVWNFSSGYP